MCSLPHYKSEIICTSVRARAMHAGADLARRQRGGRGDTQGGLWMGVGWTVELKLNRKQNWIPTGGSDPLTPSLNPPLACAWCGVCRPMWLDRWINIIIKASTNSYRFVYA